MRYLLAPILVALVVCAALLIMNRPSPEEQVRQSGEADAPAAAAPISSPQRRPLEAQTEPEEIPQSPMVVAGLTPLDVGLREDGGLGDDAYLRVDGKRVNLTRFTRPQTVFDAQVSPDGRWAYVWHAERPPRHLAVYDLQTGDRVCSFVPGYGGQLLWTRRNTILHWWASGPDCRLWRMYDTQGKVVWEGDADGLAVSLDARLMATFSTVKAAAGPLRVYDLATRQTIYTSQGKIDALTVQYPVNWSTPGTMQATCRNHRGESQAVRVLLPTVPETDLIAPGDAILQRFITRANGVDLYSGFSITLPQGRFVSPPTVEHFDIYEDKHGHDLKDRIALTIEGDGRTLVLRFHPGKEDLGSGNWVVVAAHPEAMILPRRISTKARWAVPVESP